MTKTIQIIPNNHILLIKRDDGKEIRYNLKTNNIERIENNKLIILKQQYMFFKDYKVENIICPEEKFLTMINICKELYSNCHNISTFLTRLSTIIIYEGYIQQGLKTNYSRERNYYRRFHYDLITKPVNSYNKNTIKILKECEIKIDKKFENNFFEGFEYNTKVIEQLNYIDISIDDKQDFIDGFFKVYHFRDYFKTLTNQYNYNQKSLLEYIYNYLKVFEGFTSSNYALQYLKDYYSMANRIGRNVDKYPKYLKSVHDIINVNFNAYKREYDLIRFNEMIKLDLEREDNDFSILVPKCPNDIISEGTSLNHCVASYVDRVIKGQTYIFFLRKTKTKEESLITLELNNNAIIQAKGKYNRALEKEEKEFLEKYCKKKELVLAV